MKKYLDYIFSDAILFGVVGWIFYSEYYLASRNIDLRFGIMVATVILLNVSMILEILNRRNKPRDKLSKALWGITNVLMFVEVLLM